MGIFINGKVYGNNVSIVNGQVITGDSCGDVTSKKFDETITESASGVNRITIDSDINVKISACGTNDVTAHLHGSAITNATPKLSMKRVGDELVISVKSEESSNSYSSVSMIIINSSICGDGEGLVLDVQIPSRAFEKLSVESKNANIDVTSSVNANTITVDNKNGNIDVSAIFKTLKIDCQNGNVDVDSEANCDIALYVTSKNGNADVTIHNIGTSEVSVNAVNGNCRNSPRLKGLYTASGYIISKNGNVKFH